MPAEPQLSGEEKEWLFRAATGHPSALIPPTVVAALEAAGLGAKNVYGTLDVNAVGRRYLADEHLMSAPKTRRRR